MHTTTYALKKHEDHVSGKKNHFGLQKKYICTLVAFSFLLYKLATKAIAMFFIFMVPLGLLTILMIYERKKYLKGALQI